MAIEPASEQAPEDYQAHFRDYSGFVRLFTIGAVVAFVAGFFVLMIIS